MVLSYKRYSSQLYKCVPQIRVFWQFFEICFYTWRHIKCKFCRRYSFDIVILGLEYWQIRDKLSKLKKSHFNETQRMLVLPIVVIVGVPYPSDHLRLHALTVKFPVHFWLPTRRAGILFLFAWSLSLVMVQACYIAHRNQEGWDHEYSHRKLLSNGESGLKGKPQSPSLRWNDSDACFKCTQRTRTL